MPNRRRGARHRRIGAPDQAKVGIESADRANDGLRKLVVRLGLVVESAMRLDVTDDGALGSCDGVERAELANQEILDVLSSQLHWTTAKALPIVKTRMRADSDPVPLGEGDGRPHGVRVARVQSAGHVGRGHQRHQDRVRFCVSLTNVDIEVDLPHGLILRRNPSLSADD